MDTMAVADGMRVRTSFVNGCVNEEPSRVRRSLPVAADDFTLHVDQNHVPNFEQPKVYAEWVCPKGVGKLRVSDGDVAAHTLDISFSMPVAERRNHVSKLPLPLEAEIHKIWDPLHCHASVT